MSLFDKCQGEQKEWTGQATLRLRRNIDRNVDVLFLRCEDRGGGEEGGQAHQGKNAGQHL